MIGDRIFGWVTAPCLLLLVVGSATTAQAGAVCREFRAGEKSRARDCAAEAIAEVELDRYNSTVGLLDGIGEAAVPALETALGSTKWLVRAAAADALGRIAPRLETPGKTDIVNVLAALDKDTNVKVRQQVFGSLGRIGLKTDAAERALIEGEADTDPTARQLAIHARERLK
jgi:HEAT repeat protein